MGKERGHPPLALPRKFGLLDCLIIVAVCPFVFKPMLESYRFYVGHPHNIPEIHHTVALARIAANLLLMASTIALALMMLRKPRAKWRAVLRRPGSAACFAACVALFVMYIRMMGKISVLMTMQDYDPFWSLSTYANFVRVGFAVIGAWLALLWTRSWRSEPSWIDRAGRAVGCGWIALVLFETFLSWIEPYLPAI